MLGAGGWVAKSRESELSIEWGVSFPFLFAQIFSGKRKLKFEIV